MIKAALSVLLLGMFVSIAVGQESTTDSSRLQFDELVPAQWMMHREIVDETGVNVGIVDDVILDVDNGRVAFLIVKRSKSADDHSDVKGVAFEQFLVVPSVLDEWRSDQPLKLSILLKRVVRSFVGVGLSSMWESRRAAMTSAMISDRDGTASGAGIGLLLMVYGGGFY